MANKKLVPQAKEALNQLKLEIANELSVPNSQYMNKSNLTSRQNGEIGGSIGGNMTKKLVEMAEKQLISKK